MKEVYISLGSNIDAANNMRAALKALEAEYGALQISSVYESEAVGFEGDNFLNCVASFFCGKPVEVLISELKTLEDKLGRVRSGPKFSSRTIDMDVVLYGDACGEFAGVKIPRDEITKHAFVLLPLMELAPDLIDPASEKSMKALWECCCLDMQKQKLWLADFQV
jgi:2-amino-4-hydroxy-6-hydroxymethyldihydropteridine diphosphokinase